MTDLVEELIFDYHMEWLIFDLIEEHLRSNRGEASISFDLIEEHHRSSRGASSI